MKLFTFLQYSEDLSAYFKFVRDRVLKIKILLSKFLKKIMAGYVLYCFRYSYNLQFLIHDKSICIKISHLFSSSSFSVSRWHCSKVNLSEHGGPQAELQELIVDIKCHYPTTLKVFFKKIKCCRAMTFDVHNKLL